VPGGTVLARVHRGRRRLAQLLAGAGLVIDGHERHDRLLGAFLAGDLDLAAARQQDEHLLECEQCWRAVQEDREGRRAAELLRQPAPPGLTDRVAFAVEVAAEADPDRERVHRCLGSLTGLQREAVTLAYSGGYTHRQVAALLRVAAGTVSTWIRDGLIRLRDCPGVDHED
jgi:DNA-directed RNA polymerase specialized sigma24 family protein